MEEEEVGEVDLKEVEVVEEGVLGLAYKEVEVVEEESFPAPSP